MADDTTSNRAEAFEAFDDIARNPGLDATLGAVIARRYGRREVLKGALAVTAVTALFGPAALRAPRAQAVGRSAFDFAELAAGVDETHHVAEGYEVQTLLRWGDPVFADSPAFDPNRQDARAQLRQFGYNNDYLGFVPLDAAGTRGILCVNHEYTSTEVMFRGIGGRPDKSDFAGIDRDLVEVEMAAHGLTMIEIALAGGTWKPVLTSPLNRRVTPLGSEALLDGPAAGHPRLRTSADPSGTRVLGTLNNCAGAITPWGTFLTAEENFHGYFSTQWRDADDKRLAKGIGGAQKASYERYALPANWYNWGDFHDRFNVNLEPNEANRFGWMVEVDPLDPASTPIKHTALGRFAHEGAGLVVNGDGRMVAYMGDDARFEYVYRFVSKGTFVPGDKAHNMRLLSEGTLSVARFDADGSVTWLPLAFGHGPLTPENGFESEAQVLIDARLAADALKATPMDRPEDVEVSPATGKVYVLLTNNERRKADRLDAANPRPANDFGHIIEMTPPGGDHAAETFRWQILIKCGNPGVAEVGAQWGPETGVRGWFGSPDNCVFDAEGRLWIATDQGDKWSKTGKADGLYAVETEGAARGRSRLFFRVPVGAELCGPCFTPDGETLFLSVQHPGTDGTKDWKPFGRESTYEDPATRWPDFDPKLPPRPSVLAIRKKGGGRIA